MAVDGENKARASHSGDDALRAANPMPTGSGAMQRLIAAVGSEGAARPGLPPVERWNPPWCGEIDMRIDADGRWHYMGSPIGRMPLVKLFSSVMRREGERHVLVTPVEKVGILVEDAPFQAVEMAVSGAGADRQ